MYVKNQISLTHNISYSIILIAVALVIFCARSLLSSISDSGIQSDENWYGINKYDLMWNEIQPVPPTITATFQSVGTADGWILESAETSNTGGFSNATAALFYLGDDEMDRQYRSILSFNTTALPDTAVITKATLKIRVYGALIGNDNPFSWGNGWGNGLRVDICKGNFGTTGALQLTDFNFNDVNNCNIPAGTFGDRPSIWFSVNLPDTARNKINTIGRTQFRLRFAKDDNDDLAADYWRFYSGNHSAASVRPTLIIEYYVP